MRSLHLYRRGARWWYRVGIPSPAGKRMDIRLPLGPLPFSLAQHAARLLDADVTMIVALGYEMFRRGKRSAPTEPPVHPSDEDLYAAMRAHLEQRIRHYLGRHAARDDSGDFLTRRRENMRDIDLLTMLIDTGTTRTSVNRHRLAEYMEALRDQGIDEVRLAELRSAWDRCSRTENGNPIPAHSRDDLYADMGRTFDVDALARLDRLLLESEREAVWRAELRRRELSSTFGDNLPGDDEGRPFTRFPHLPMTLAELEAHRVEQAERPPMGPVVQQDEAAALLPPAPSAVQPLRPQQTGGASTWSAKTVGEIADQLVATRSAGGANWSGAAPLGAMLKLMKHVMGGDRPFSELRQEHLGNFRDLMGHLPTRWGRTREEQLHGIPAALSRASTLESDAVGLTGATIVKHLHYLEKFLEFAHARGAKPAEPLNLNTLKKEAQTQKVADHDENGRGRDNWDPEELAALLNTPAFVGSKGGGRKERHAPGQLHFHDCDYWMLLLLIHTGARSSELAGLRLDEVLDTEPIPLIVFKNNPNRRIKTKAGRRRIPVHPELIRLNFVGYVHAMRAAGHVDLFPELKPGANQSWASLYMKHFTYLRKAAFPNGAKGAAQLKGAEKQKDVHGIRGTFIRA